MRKSKRKQLMLAALTGLLVLTPVQSVNIPVPVYAGQVPAASDSRLSEFDIAPGTLNPAFSPDVFEYTAAVEAGVTGVSVRAIPRSANGTIASVEGARSLSPGVNTIKVTCSAQDFTTSVYTITLTVGSAGAQQPDGTGTQQPDSADAQQPDGADLTGTQQPDSTGTQQPDDAGITGAQQPDSTGTQQPDETEGSPASSDAEGAENAGTTKKKKKKKKSALSSLVGQIGSDGTVTLNGAAYRLSNNFSYSNITQDIPSAFGQGSVQIAGTSYSTLYCAQGDMNLVYMENTDGNGSTGFYFYDDTCNAVERFKYVGTGDNFVVFISSSRAELPAGYQEKALELPSGKEVMAYQNKASDEMQDYYLIYGIHSSGSSGWYLFDNAQDTYMRYSNAFTVQAQEPEEEEEVARTVSLVKYNSLNEKYSQLKKNNVRIVSILAVAMVLMIIVFTAILLRSRDEADDGQEPDRENGRMKKMPRSGRGRRQTEPVSKSSLAAGRNFDGRSAKNAKKVTKTFTKSAPQADTELPRTNRQDEISTPEEIRAQVNREQGIQKGWKNEKDHRAYEQQLREQRVYEQKLREQQAAEADRREQQLKEQQAADIKRKEQQMYEQKRKEQQLKEQQLREQQAYEQKLEQQRAYPAGAFDAGSTQPKNLLKKEQAAGSTDSVQLAAEKMRQSVKYARKNAAEQPEHDPMDDWEVEEPTGRRPQKSGRKKRSLMDEDMEIMDLNDL